MEVSKYWKIVEFPKISIKIKNVKYFKRPKQRSALSKLFSLSHALPLPPSLPNHKNIYTEIYRHLLPKCFKNVVLGCQKMVRCKCFFWQQTKKMFAGKFVKWVWFLLEHIIFKEHITLNVKRVEVRKMSEVFWAKLYCKRSDLFFARFCWPWDYLLEIWN